MALLRELLKNHYYCEKVTKVVITNTLKIQQLIDD